MLKFLKRLLILLILITPALSQAQQWAAKYKRLNQNDAVSENKSYAITTSKSNFIYVTGFSTSDSTGSDYCTIKYDQDGSALWVNNYNGSGNSEDKAYAIVVDDQDNVYVTGYTTELTAGTDITTLKYSPTGALLHESTYNGPGNGDDRASAICIDANGYIYVTGYETTAENGKDIVIIKYNANLTILWTYHYNRLGFDDIANAMALDGSGKVVVTGSSCSGSTEQTEDMITIKVDTGGTQVWAQPFIGGGNQSDKAYAITVDDQDNVIITGYSTGITGTKDITTIKYSASGSILWEKIYDRGYNDIALSITLTTVITDNISQNVIVTGSSQSGSTPGKEDYITIGYNGTTGDSLWGGSKIYNGTGENTDIAYSTLVSPFDNSIYVTGSSKNEPEEGTEDIVTFKYDATSGDVIDSSIYNDDNNGEDVAYDMAIDSLGNVYVTGYVAPGGGLDRIQAKPSEFLTLKYNKGHLVSRNSNVIPGSFKLDQNYPNPFNPSTTLKFLLPSSGIAKITVYDILGRQVDVLVNQFMKSGDYSVVFNGNQLSSGIYFAELTFGNLKDVKKMVLIK